ncbi:MAG: lipase family protein [Deltaproteobacteria bacterium]|nr:lipase family protein [Candidatus Zymogenaceae bacterium]
MLQKLYNKTLDVIGKGGVDFTELLHMAEVYRSVRYETKEEIFDKWGRYFEDIHVVDIKKTKNRYLIGTVRKKKLQEVYILGTTNFTNLLHDLNTKHVKHRKLGIMIHKGFSDFAKAVYDDIIPRIDVRRKLIICGHSLGGAAAVILALMLRIDEFPVKKVFAFGQPKFTDLEGADTYNDLDVIRVINEGDIIPQLPPDGLDAREQQFRHLGKEVILLDGRYYSLNREHAAESRQTSDLWDEIKRSVRKSTLNKLVRSVDSLINVHLIDAYIDRIIPKWKRSTKVPYEERNKYIKIIGQTASTRELHG